MEFKQYKELVKSIPVGKQLPDAVYLHESALDSIPTTLALRLAKIITHHELDKVNWNLIKLFKRDHRITLLHYPDFFDDPYPALQTSYTINLESGTVKYTKYDDSDNPPILHRKEAFLKPDHPEISRFLDITKKGEDAGLYENTRNIGHKKQWERLISRKGYLLGENGHLIPKCNGKETTSNNPSINIATIERHLTAIDRNKLSVPMQILARHNYFNGDYSILDFGCGKGDDVRELEAHGLDINAWDPVYRPDGQISESDIVNLGYVLNIIEDRKERDRVLQEAYTHAKIILTVSVMLGSDAITSQYTPYKDGVITQRNTFQKYYSQSEFRSYLESTLDETPVAVGPGIFFVFKDKDEEQLFLSERQKIRRDWKHLVLRERKTTTTIPTAELIDKHKQLFEDFWLTTLNLGRLPANDEYDFSIEIRNIIGSHKKAFEALCEAYNDDDFKQAQNNRKGDLLVYLSLGLFGQRKPYTHIPESLKRDLKAFFNTYNNALEEAKYLLFSVGNPENIEKSCLVAYEEMKCGLLEKGHSFTIHSSLLNKLPPVLRVYVGCAAQLYGDIEGIDLIKIHILSGKVTLLRFDNWDNNVPMLIERIKIKMRDQDIDFFNYAGKYKPQPLLDKIMFYNINST